VTGAGGTAAPPPRRRHRRRRIALLLTAFAVAAAGAVALGALAARAHLETWILEQARSRLAREGFDLTVGELRVDLSRLEARASRLGVAARSDRPGTFRLSAGEVAVGLSWRALPGLGARRVHLARVEVRDWSVETDDAWFERPRTAGEPLALDLRIDRLRLECGRFTHEDRAREVDLAAAAIDLTAAWSADRRAMIGRLATDAAVEAGPPLAAPLPVRVATGFRWRGREVELFGLEAEAAGVRARADGSIDARDALEVSVFGTFDADLATFAPRLEPGFPDVAGALDGTFRVAFRAGEPVTVRADVHAVEARFGTLAAASADARVTVRPDGLRLETLDATAWGGRTRGTVEVAFGTPIRVAMDLTSDGLDARTLLEWVDLPLPLAAELDAAFRLELDPADRGSWNGSGSFTARAPAAPSGVPVSGGGRFGLAGGVLEVEAAAARAGAATLATRLALDLTRTPVAGSLTLDGRTDDVGLTQRGTLIILRRLGVTVPDTLAVPLAGTGTLAARVGLGGEPDVELRMTLGAGAWGPQRFDRAEAAVRLAGTRLQVERVAIEDGAAHLAGEAVVRLDPLALERADATFDGVGIGSLLALAATELDLDGLASGMLRAETGPDGVLRGSGRVRVADARAFGERVDHAAAELELLGAHVAVRGLEVRGPAVDAAGEARFDAQAGRGELELGTALVRLDRVEGLAGVPAAVRGILRLQGHITADADGPRGTLDVLGSDVGVGEFGPIAFGGRLDLDADGIGALLASDGDPAFEVSGHVGWAEPWPLRAAVHLDRSLIDFVPARRAPLWAELSGTLLVHGPLARPEQLELDGRIDEAELFLGARRLRLDGPAPVRYADGVFEAAAVRLVGPESSFVSRLRYDRGANRIRASSTGTVDLALLSALVPEARAVGLAELELEVGGSPEAPELSGRLRVERGRLRWLGLPDTFEQVELAIRFERDRAELTDLRAVLGGGEVTGTGHVRFGTAGVEAVDLSAEVSGVRLEMPEHFEAVYDARLRLAGTPAAMTLGGRVQLVRALYDQNLDMTSLLGYGAREYSAADPEALPDFVALDLVVVADDRVWVRNDLAELEARLDLHVGGTLPRPEVTGRIWVVEGGKLVFRDVEYTVRSGSLDLLDPTRLDPYIQLDADTTAHGYEILLHVEGTLDQFDYQLTSNPSLAPQDIIALLTTGRTLEDVGTTEGAGRAITGDVAADYFVGALTAGFEKQLERALGLERFQISPLLVDGADPTTRVTIGKSINEEVSVIVSSDVGSSEDVLYQVEWRASPKLMMTAERDVDGGIGGKLRYTNRYWWKKRQAEEGRVPAPRDRSPIGPEPEARRVRAISIEGVPTGEAAALRERLPLEVGAAFSRSAMFAGQEEIRRRYVRDDRILVQVASSVSLDDDGAAVRYDVDPGPRVAVSFEGVRDGDRKVLRAELDRLWVESLFQENPYADGAERVREFYEARGYYAADVRTAVAEAEDGSRTVTFRVDTGDVVRVDDVVLEGVSGIDEDRIRRQILTRTGTLFARKTFDPAVLREDVAAIRNLYRDEGYLVVSIAEPRIRVSLDGTSVEVTLSIDEGPRFTIGGLDYPELGNRPAAELREWAGLREGDVFSRQRLIEAEARIRVELDRRGYPDARVRGHTELGSSSVQVRFDVDPGERKRVGAVRITGNVVTRESVIRRELELAPGDAISREKILQGQHRLYRLGVFRSVRITYEPIEDDPGRYRLDVRVREAPPLRASVGVGYNTEAGATLSLSSSQHNLAGRLRTVGVQGEVSGILRQLQVVGKVPRLLGSDLPGLANVGWEEREEEGFSLRRWTSALRADRKLTGRWSGFVRYSYQLVDVFDVEDPEALQEEKLEDVVLGDVGIALVRDSRDDLLLPTRGSYLSIGSRLFAQPLLSEETFLNTQVTEARVWTFPNGTSFTTAARLGIADPFGSSDSVPISERFFAGGDATNRGFARDRLGPIENDQPVGGEGMLLFNQEFRFPIWGRLKGEVFYDAGNVYRLVSDIAPTDLRHVGGLGLRLETPIGPLRAEYGWKLDREPGESPGQFYLAIGSAF